MVGIIKETGQVHRNSGIFISKKMIAEIGFILVIAVIALVAIEAFQSSTTLTGLQQKDAQQAEQATYTGAATSSQANNAGQESLGTTEKIIQTDKWYSLGNNAVDKREITLKDYSTVVLITVEAKGLITATLLDTKLREQGKVLEVKVKVANSGNNKVFETLPSTIGQGVRTTDVVLGDWRELMNDKPLKIDSRTITWQPEFEVKNLPNQQNPIKKDSI